MKKIFTFLTLYALYATAQPTTYATAQPTSQSTTSATAQDGSGPKSLKQCIRYSLDNNASLQKDRLGVESANQSRLEIIGSLLPQLNASGGYTYNIQKTTFAMPNFVNSMMPESMQDPNAPKYMTVTMGMDQSANVGVALTQQILNFSLFSAASIAKAGQEMAELGVIADSEDVMAKTATLYYNAQVLEYSMGLFDESLAVMDRLSGVMEANREIGLVRNVDADRIAVTKMNLETEKSSLLQAVEIQKSLLKLQMGFPMDQPLELEPVDLDELESIIFLETLGAQEIENQMPFRLLKQQQTMLELQRKAAVAECLPMLSLSANYSRNFMGDHFYGETFNQFPVSMVSLNLRVPIFNGMSKAAKVKKAEIEMEKARKDENVLVQSLTMGFNNARMQLEQNRGTICSQRRNKELAQKVLDVTESNYNEGLATLSDLLNASSSLVQAQMNYVSALGNCIKAYIDLKKADGTINELNR